MANREEKREERIEASLKSETNIEELELKSFNILNSGREMESPYFEYEASYSTKEFIKKVGPNYLIAIGRLIDQQILIEKDEEERNYDIYMPYARSFNHKIEFEIPAGYTIDGVDDLNFVVEHSSGGFVSKATLINGKLFIETKKYYAHNYEKKEQWTEMLDFLGAAHDFSQKSILLKKITE